MNTDSTFSYKSLFGPVPSRRLGISLGVDLVPHKTCNLNCVYCECGPTTHLTTTCDEYIEVDRVKAELTDYLLRNENIDHITFSGSGEPTLNSGIGEIVAFLKQNHPRHRVALLTNGTLFDQPVIRRRVQAVDVVMASCDAAVQASFRRINRPHPDLDLAAIMDGLKAFRRSYAGRFLIEYFVVPGINDTVDELSRMRILLEDIAADGVVLNTLDRPGAEDWVRPVDAVKLDEISVFFKDAEKIKHDPVRRTRETSDRDLLNRLVATIRRRPHTAADVSTIMGMELNRLQPMLDRLVAADQLRLKHEERGLFYVVSQNGFQT
jgi:wyosine [tRNA(Phe)-imidazoG37] synthetase (radical SAM superfamily)